ncbi:MAG: O-antigen ligase family protein [Gemmatimonadaceae bacterium]|nr:O-antigen ligase family protein [Gemmatimonadaceae bacterium]
MTLFDRHGEGLGKRAGPFRLPWAILAVWMLIGWLVSPSPDLTLPKFTGMALGMLALRAVLLTGTTSARVWLLAGAYVLAGSVMVAGGLLAGPRWLRKVEFLYHLDGQIPRVVLGLPGAAGGVNSTALGGATLWLLPVATVLALYGLRRIRQAWQAGAGRGLAILETIGCGIAALLSFFVLALSQARGAWLSVPIVGVLVLVFRFRLVTLPRALGAAAALAAFLWLGPWSFSTIVGFERPYIWSLAVNAIRAHPIAGVGLGAFRIASAGPAPDFGVDEVFFVAHAHNIFLQVALDVGIPGLLAYVALLGLATRMMYQILRRDSDGHKKALCLGLWANLVAIHVFGLADAIALGTKVGVFFWWSLGLIAALHDVARRRWVPVG